MVHSRAFGLSIESDELIPGLHPLDAPASTNDRPIRIHFDAAPAGLDLARDTRHPWPDSAVADAGERTTRSVADGRWISVAYLNGVQFLVSRDGEDIWFLRPDAIPLDDVATYLLGPIIGLVMRMRGFLCLHASAVAINDRAFPLVGAAESGKSTTAASLARRGITVLSDDIAVVEFVGESHTPIARPGYPRLRLWPDSSTMVLGAHVELERLTPAWDKRYLDLPGGDSTVPYQACPLGAIYLFADRTTEEGPSIRPLSAREGLLSLVANSYANLYLDASMRRDEFLALTRLSTRVPMFRLTPRAEFSRLDEMCELLLEHATTVGRRDFAVARENGAT